MTQISAPGLELRAAQPAPPAAPRERPRGWRRWAILVVLLVSGTVTALATRDRSVTFDETFMVASSARGYHTGRFDMTIDHPPITQYLYGLPLALAHPNYPKEAPGRWGYGNRFRYGQAFLFQSGNDPQRLVFLARLVAVLMAMGLVFTVYAFTRARAGWNAGILAAVLVAFLPDVLAHGGLAYNDVPTALAYLGGIWSLDRAVRVPSIRRVLAAVLVCAVALTVKFSALALAPVALALIAMEGLQRGADRTWWRRIGVGLAAGVVVFYLALVVIYLGDFGLTDFRYGLQFNIMHAEHGHGGVPAFLLGQRSPSGFWYFYPVVFFMKTPVGLHLLMLLGLVGWLGTRGSTAAARAAAGAGTAGTAVDAPDGTGAPGAVGARQGASLLARVRPAGWLAGPLRPVVVGALVFLAFLLKANLNIGFRHALPLLPLVVVLTAVGAVRFAETRGRAGAWAVGVLAALAVASSLSYYPHFLTYISEYGPGRDRGGQVVIDSSYDWGQGLLDLKKWMDRNGVDRVYLSYFGSGLPAAYGIDYVPLASFFPLPPGPSQLAEHAGAPPAPAPKWVVISATNLQGTYLGGDPFAAFRAGRPAAVIAHHLYVYPVAQ